MRKLNSLLWSCIALLFSVPISAQFTYNTSGPTPYTSTVLLNTESTSSSTGWTDFHADNAGGTGNTWSSTYAMPFTFDFFGSTVTHFMVSKNFLLSFDTTLTGTTVNPAIDTNSALPNANLPNNTICYFWDGFGNPAPLGTNDHVWVKEFGTAPNRQLWIKNFSYETEGQSFTYNFLVLEESTNNIYFLDARNATVGTGSRTIGVQQNATTAVQFANSPNIVAISTNTVAISGSYFEFNPRLLSPNEAGVSSIDAPSQPFSAGIQTVTATVNNYGTNNLDTVTVAWTANGATQTPVLWVNTIAPNSSASVNLGTFNFASATTIKAWTENPNQVPDPFNSNDTTEVTLNPTLPGGTYTINQNAPASATNFTSFTAASAALGSGISGPVIFNVVPNSGPYNEQFIVNEVLGASATNTITVNGNGDTLSFAATTADRRIVGLDGADHITIDSLTIVSTDGTYAYGVHLMNNADSNVIINCTINTESITSTSSANSSGIVISNAINSLTGDGDNGDYNTFENNNIIGGASGGAYYGIYLNGNGTTANGFGNRIIGNTFQDFYAYAIYIDDQEDLLVSRNDISRPNRTATTTGYGVFSTSGASQNMLIERNRVHNMNDGDPTPTSAVYPFYNSSTDATAGNENLVVNNLVYDISGTGTIYGIYNIGSDNVFYYHNTISLDNAAATGGTTRGFYQTTTATGVEFRNNIVSVTRGGSGTKHGIYLNTAASTITCNNNNIYVNSAGTGAQHYGRDGGIDQTSFTDWQTANSSAYDQNSSNNNPDFISASDLTPQGFGADNSGANLSVLEDFFGVARTMTPDMGAIEYTGPVITCFPPTQLGTHNLTATSVAVRWVESGTATQWQVEYDTIGFTQGTGIDSIASNDTLTINGLNPETAYQFYVRAICGPNDTSFWVGPIGITTPCAAVMPYYIEDFNSFVPNCWEQAGAGSPATGPNTFGNSLWGGDDYLHDPSRGQGFNINLFTTTREDWVISPTVDLSIAGGPYELRIEAGVTNFNTTAPDNMGSDDTVQVLISTNGGVKWDPIYTWDVNNQPPNTGDFYRIDLSAYTGSNNLFAIWATDGPVNDIEDYDFHIGSFEIRTIPNCLDPTNNPIVGIGRDSIDISWIENGIASSWEIQVDTVGFPAGSGNSTIVTVDTFATISGLMPSSSYEYYLRSICGRGDTSAWAGPIRFTTLCAPLTAPYTMDFDAASGTGDFNNAGVTCWRATGPGANDVDISTTTDQGVPVPSAPNAVELNDGTWPNDSAILVSPQFSDLSSGLNRIRFQAAFESATVTNVNMYIGVMTDPDDAATFVAIDTIDATDVGGGTNFDEIVVNFDNTALIGTAEYIAIAHGIGAFEAYVDDFVYEAIPPNDLSVTAIVRPTYLCGVTTDSVEVVISNVGSASQSNFMVGYSVDGVAATPETFTGTIPPGTSANFVFNTLATVPTGTSVDIQAYSLLTTDSDLTNDTSASSVASFSNIATFPYNESFEAGNGSWSATGNASWQLGVPASTIIDTASDGTQAWVTNLTGQYGNNELGFVESPCFDFSSIADPFIELDIWYEAENSFDGAALQSSIDGGATWQLVGALNDTVNWYNDGTISGISGAEPSQDGWTGSPGSAGWITAKHYLDNLGNIPNVRLRLVFGSNASTTGEGVGFDNIKIFDNPRPCFAPTALDSRNIMPTSADLAWTDNNNISSWEISYGAPNFTAGSGTQILVNTNPFNLTNLTQGTDYEWYIRAICGPGDTSVWSDTAAFRTILPTVPYYPVGTINTQDATTGVADSMGVACNTSGIVVGVDLDGNGGYVFTIIDMASGNQEGIGIFNSSDVDGYVVNQGDSVMIRGSVSQFNGLTQLSSIDSITVIATGVTLPTPIVVDFPSEGTESKWIQINNATAVTASGAQGSNNNQTFSRNGVNFTLRVDRDTDVDDSLAVFPLAIGDSLCQVIGIGGQFDSSNPFTTGYQILPARYADLDTSACSFVVGIEDTQLEEKAFVLVPNPTNGLFEIRTNGFQNETINLVIRDLSGRIIENQIISNANSAFQRAFDLENNAKGIYFISIQDGESIINEKLILH